MTILLKEKSEFIIKLLEEDLEQEGMKPSHVWHYIKDFYGVTSTVDLSEDQWRKIARRLTVILRDPLSRDKFIRNTWNYCLNSGFRPSDPIVTKDYWNGAKRFAQMISKKRIQRV